MLSDLVERHINLHRATGYLFQQQALQLRQFARYAATKGDEVVRAATAVEWASRCPSESTRQVRLQTVSRFARLMHAEDARHEIPPEGVFGPRRRRTPHIFTEGEIRLVLRGAAALGPKGSLRPHTYTTLLGIIAATGMRVSEALRLKLDDVTAAGLVVRQTKFRKSRLVPLHATARKALDDHLALRRAFAGTDDAVFLSERCTGLSRKTVHLTFTDILRSVGLDSGRGRRPRVHDFRHTFAVRSLEQCKGTREDVARHMLALSTYLGHAQMESTYWYLQATPRLLLDIAARSEAYSMGGAL
jgi:integrase